MQTEQMSKRVKMVRKQLRDQSVDAMIVMGVENVRYLTGFTGHDSWVLVLPRAVILLTDSRYTEQALGECVGCKVVQRRESLSKEADEIFAKQKNVNVVGIEDACSIVLLKRLRKALSVKLKPVSGVVEKVRLIKDDVEVKLISKASRIAFNAMEWALGQLKPGMTERQLGALYEFRLSEYGATVGFETIVCFGPNGSRNHHQPGERKLRKNDSILLDFGAKYQGYISDTTRCFAVGKVTEFYRKVYETVARAQKAVIESIKPGAKMCDADKAARDVIAAADLPVYGHGTGHGVGLQVHEEPFLSGQNKKGRFEVGQVITVEPGIYLPGKLGVRLEDDVLVTETGFKIVSADKRFDIKIDDVPVL